MQFQLATLPPSLSHQLKWERFVNTHGGMGKNIPCDLFNEHMNKLFKEIINNMGPNMTATAISRSARSVTTLCNIRDRFDQESNVPVPTSAHCTKSDHEDVAKVAAVLIKNKILSINTGRELNHFKKFSENPLSNLNWTKMEQWILRKQKQTVALKYALGEGNLSDSDATDCSEAESDSES